MQIYINRTVPLDDLLTVETLHGYTFTREQSGHVFDIGCTRGGSDIELSGTCYAYFRRADNTTVHLNTEDVAQIDELTGHAVVTLHPDCYNVPGRFQLSVYNATESGTVCIYCAVGMVQDTVSGTTLDVSGQSGYDTAVFARNIGAIEGELETVRAENAGIIQALAAANIRALNTPNLLKKQPNGVSVNVPSGTVITETITIPAEDATAAAETLTYTVTNESITSSMVLHGRKSSDGYVYVNWQTIAGTAAAGSMTVTIGARSGAHAGSITVTLYICAVTTATLPYGESARSHAYGEAYITSIDNPNYTDEAGDEIKERLVTLTGNDIITDADEAVYNTAVAFTVTDPPSSGYNNADMLSFYYGNGRYDTAKGYSASLMGDIEEMEVGETYTFSCFARITSGTNARLIMVAGSTTYSSSANYGHKQYIELTNTEWKRVSWSFVFNPQGPNGAQYYSYTDDDKTYMSAYWQKKVGIGVCRAYAGTVQLAGFRLTKNGLYGDNTVDTLSAEVAEARATNAQNTAQVATVTSQMNSLLASVAPVEPSTTASANYGVGELLVLNGKLYKTSTAIVTGDTLTVGTNITATTLAAELAALNA